MTVSRFDQIPKPGDNNPPSQIELVEGVISELSRFLSDVPVIQSPEDAKRAAELIKRSGIALRELDEERDGNVRPLNERVKAINASYKRVTEPLNRIAGEIKARLTAHARAEEDRRAAEADARRREAEAAEKAAQEAAEREREAIENAAAGEIGLAVADAITDTAVAQEDAARAARALAIAEKDVPVRVATGYGRAVAMRTVETLVVENQVSALLSLWPHEKIRDAILSAAREYRKATGRLPKGIGIHLERKM